MLTRGQQRSRQRFALVRQIAAQVAEYRLHLALIVVLDVLTIPLSLLFPVPLTIAVDALLGAKPGNFVLRFVPASLVATRNSQLLLAAGLMLAIGVLQHLLGLVNWLVRTYTGERLVLSFRSRLFAHVQRLSLAYHDRTGAADPTYRIQYDATSIQNLTIQGAVPFVNACVMVLGMLYITLRLDWQLAVLALVAAPCMLMVTRSFSRSVHQQWRAVKDRDSSAMRVVQEVLGSVRVVKAFGQEQREHERFVQQSSEYVEGQIRLSRLQSTFYVLVGTLVVLVGTVALYVGAHHVIAGALTVGQLLIALTYLGKLQEPLTTISGKMIEMQSWLVSMERALALLEKQPGITEPARPHPIRRAIGAVRFRNVEFGYEAGQTVLGNVNLNIAPGTRVAVVGKSGSGKSTLISLLMRMYDPRSGDVLLDCVDLREWKLSRLREQFTIVLQEPFLFSTTIAENIAYTRAGASHAEIVAAAKAAGAHEFISELPDGYNTQIGERGACLSGGQRQRLALARAFLKNAPIVILDEPTSALDQQTEAEVVEATERLLAGRTTFIIAHRPSTIHSCELKLSIENGRVRVLDRTRLTPVIAAAKAGSRPEFEWGDVPAVVM